jgi:hypothetical protein
MPITSPLSRSEVGSRCPSIDICSAYHEFALYAFLGFHSFHCNLRRHHAQSKKKAADDALWADEANNKNAQKKAEEDRKRAVEAEKVQFTRDAFNVNHNARTVDQFIACSLISSLV